MTVRTLLLLLSLSVPAGGAFGAALPASGDLLAQDEGAPKKKKEKKKRKKKGEAADGADASAETGGEDAVAPAGGGHGAQGSSGPYRGILTVFTGGFLLLDIENTPEEGDPSKTSGNALLLGARLLFLVGGMFGVGPVFEYGKSSFDSESSSTDEAGKTTTEAVKFESTEMKFGVAAQVFFGDVDRAAIVPFAAFEFASVSTDSTLDGESTGKESGTDIQLGGGAEFFLAQHVAFEPQLFYRMVNRTKTNVTTSFSPTGGETTSELKTTKKSSEFGVTAGLSLFL